jgi:hypothetical protein
MLHQRRPLAILVIALPALICGALGALQSAGPFSRARELAEAEHRWAGRTFNEYRMAYEDFKCLQHVEVRNERIVKPDTSIRCALPARSVSELYDLIRRDGSAGTRCVTQGCACDDEVVVRASYDAQLGYPRQIEVRMRPRPNMLHPDFWQYLARHLRPPDCDFMEGNKMIYIRSLEPLPETR